MTTVTIVTLTIEQVKAYFEGKGLNVEDPGTTNLTYNKMLVIVKDAEATYGKEFSKFVRSIWDKTTKESATGKRKFWNYFPKYKSWNDLTTAYTASIKK